MLHVSYTPCAALKSELITTCELDFVNSACELDSLCCTEVRVNYYM